MTAGMAFEALNNAGVAEGRLLVVLNDNDMSISPPVGALNRYLAQLMSGQFYSPQPRTWARPCSRARRRCSSWPSGSKNTPRAWWCRPRCSRSSASTTSAPSMDTTSIRSFPTLENVRHLLEQWRRPAVPARGHQKRPGLQAGRGRPGGLPRPRQVRPGRGHSTKPATPAKTTFTQVFGPVAVRHGRGRPQAGRHHARHARRLGHGGV